MDRETARREIRGSWRSLIMSVTSAAKKKVNGETSYICPFCNHGQNGDGLTRNPKSSDGNGLKCFGCGWSGDIIDLYQKATGADFRTALRELAQTIGVTIDERKAARAGQKYEKPRNRQICDSSDFKNQTSNDTAHSEKTPCSGSETATEGNVNYTDYYKVCAEQLNDPDDSGSLAARLLIQGRGISLETANAYGFGYDPAADPACAPGAMEETGKRHPCPRIIIPITSEYYLTRRVDGIADFDKMNSKNGKADIFNLSVLYEKDVREVFVTEGVFDALSVIEAGYNAIALNSANYAELLVKKLEERQPKATLILSLDNDVRGNEAETILKKACERLKINYIIANISAGYKDPNEAWIADSTAFIAAVKRAVTMAQEKIETQREIEREALKKETVAYALQDFIQYIRERTSVISTGFSSLDTILDGGLYAGLYIVGAISSLGKTTFCLQIADQIAQAGHDVLIFSLEMSRNELIAKSLSCLTFIKNREVNGENSIHAKTTRGILTYSRWKTYSNEELELILTAMSIYGKYGENIYITEGVGNIGVTEIRERVQNHIQNIGKQPVVIIDYLQIIAPVDIKATDKQNTDKAVLELKRLSRDYNIPVIGISSFNRDNYTAPVNMASFKESGAIEYSSDVLIGLQYEGMDYQEGEKDVERTPRIRELMKQAIENGKAGKSQRIQVKVLKHRNGSKGDAYLDFYPMFNYFTERPKDEKNKTENENSGVWSRVNYTPIVKPQKSKREIEREKLASAFFSIQKEDCTADLTALADVLDKSKKQVQNLIAEYGGYIIDGETVNLLDVSDKWEDWGEGEDVEEWCKPNGEPKTD